MSRQERTERLDTFLKEFEWNWTKAVLASLGITFVVYLTAIVIPSFWTYYAEDRLDWAGPTDIESAVTDTKEFLTNPTAGYEDTEWTEDGGSFVAGLFSAPIPTMEKLAQGIPRGMGQQIRDAIAMGLTTVFFILPFAVAVILQNRRRKLRGADDKRPGGGYY